MEILNVINGAEIVQPNAWFWISLVALLFGVALMGLSAMDGLVGGILFGLCLALFAVLLMILPIKFFEPTGEFEPTKYEVRITDPNYVIDAQKYSIVDKRGEIITLKEVKK